ncbi:hypothetical protein [Mucilaginibacter pedocola]|nr:hypothetical protein [Mucilaginibacter pedocola]
MDIEFRSRKFHPEEIRLLKSLKSTIGKQSLNQIKYYHFLIAAGIGAAFTYFATLTSKSFWVLPFGTIAVLAIGFIVFVPFEIFKARRKTRGITNELDHFIESGIVATSFVSAKRIALAKEYDDEGNLFIIELTDNRLLYFWDYEYNLRGKFPCLEFDVYEDRFYKLIGRQIYPLSALVKPLVINKKAKWNYMKKMGVPGHLQTDDTDFDKLIENYNGVN